MDFSAKQKPFRDAAKRAEKKYTVIDGERRLVKFSPMHGTANRIKMVSPSGTVVEDVSLGSAPNDLPPEQNQYGLPKLRQKIRDGWLPYSECPIARGYTGGKMMDVPVDGKPCKGKDGRGNFSDDEACPHIDAIQKARAAVHTKAQQDYKAIYESEQLKAQRAQVEATERLTQIITGNNS